MKKSSFPESSASNTELATSKGGVHEALQRGLEKVEGEAKLWALQVGVRLSSQRGVWPGFNLSCDVIRLMASGGVSLDFDPYV